MLSSVYRLHNCVSTSNLSRCICSTGVPYNHARESRFLKQMLTGNKKKKLFFNNSGTSRPPSLKDESNVINHNNRRTEVLNKIFMKHITDLMATGEVAPQLVGRGIDICQVKITNDFKLVNVYWYSRFDTQLTEQILDKCSGLLQHELSQLRVIGVVPPIKFVKDNRQFFLNEVDKRLSIIDFGEDYVPVNKMEKKSESIVFTKFSSETKDVILKLNIANQSKDDYDIDLPEMRHDVFGLNCSLIMKKIQASVEKNKTATLKQTTSISDTQFPEKFTSEQFYSNTERRTLFNNFLKQQQIQNKSKRKTRYENNRRSEEFDDVDYDDYDDVGYHDSIEDNQDFIIEEEELENCK